VFVGGGLVFVFVGLFIFCVIGVGVGFGCGGFWWPNSSGKKDLGEEVGVAKGGERRQGGNTTLYGFFAESVMENQTFSSRARQGLLSQGQPGANV